MRGNRFLAMSNRRSGVTVDTCPFSDCAAGALIPFHPVDYILRAADAADAAAVAACVDAAYRPYIERIGRTPGPMLLDYAGYRLKN